MIRPYEPSRDYHHFCSWHHARNQDPERPDVLPPIGLVSDECAMGFLVIGKGCSQGYVESVISDPGAPALLTGRAVIQLVQALVSRARLEGCRILTCFTDHPSVSALAQRSGARIRQELVVLECSL